MGTSGNPAKKAASPAKKTPAKKSASAMPAQVSDIGAFKKRREGQLLPLPSGLVVRAKRVELQTFIRQGNIPNPLMEVVSEALEKGKKADIPKMVGVEEGNIDLNMVNDMYDMVNAVVVASVTEPKFNPIPSLGDVEAWNESHPEETVSNPEELRDDDLLYVDEMDDLDRMFIFQWTSGGTSDLERFRQETAADMASLAEVQGS